MKKFIAILLIAVMLLGLAACSINKSEVSILWSGDGIVKVPNSLINATERAMYIEKIDYAHYGANGDQAEQVKQAEAALNAGCAALAVELVDASAAQQIVDLAKAKNVPVVFFNCEVDAAVVSGYDKCILINTAAASVDEVLGTLIAESISVEEKKLIKKTGNYLFDESLDRNEDGAISYLAVGDVSATVAKIDSVLAQRKLPALVEAAASAADASAVSALTVEAYTNKDGDPVDLLSAGEATVELILAENDLVALDSLVALQEKGFNENKLKTHCIPVYTVGANADYKEYVLAGKPAGELDSDEVQAYFKDMMYLADLSGKEQEDLDVMFYTTADVIGTGRLTGTAIEDYDSIAIAVATVLGNLLKGDAVMDDVDSIVDGISAADQTVSIRYTTVSAD